MIARSHQIISKPVHSINYEQRSFPVPCLVFHLLAINNPTVLVTNEYITYRGGRQSPYRLNNNIEFVVIVNTEKKSTGGDIAKIESRILHRKLLLQAKKAYSKERLKKLFDADPVTKSIMFREKNDTCLIDTNGFYKIDGRSLEKALEGISEEGMRGLYDRLRCARRFW